MRLLCLDPGGEDGFGWCVAQASDRLPLTIIDAGVAGNAHEAIANALDAASGPVDVSGVGIDSPMFWVANGDRKVDHLIRAAIRRLGARNASGTVQHVNSLRGACLTQGVMAAHLIRQRGPNIPVTETHPKALLWLLGVYASFQPPVRIKDLSRFAVAGFDVLSEHERDAALGALGAWAMVTGATDWIDLFPLEASPFAPVSPVQYWMPRTALST